MPAAKSANLCWAQHHHLLRYLQVPVESRHEAHISVTHRLPAGCTVEHARSALNLLVRRHEALRTVYDLNAWPWPQQIVEPAAPLPVHRVTTEDDGTPSPVQVIRRLSETAFDITREWPMRICAVTTGGLLKRLHLIFNHLSFDDVSFALLFGELDTVLAARTRRRPVTLPPVRFQPVDLARYEAARPAEAVDAAMDHWRDEVRRLPADGYASRRRRAPAAPPAAHSASFTTPSLLVTARAIASRHRVWPSAVHLAAYAVTTAAYTGEPLIAYRMYTSQREASGYHSVLTCSSYPTLVRMDLADDPPFSTVLGRAAASVEQSMAHAHVPYDRIVELVSRESSRRGQRVDVAAELNFLNYAPRSCRTRRDRFVWNACPVDWAKSGLDSYFRIYEWCDGITLALQAMDEVMDADAVRRFLRGYARLVEAHREPGTDLLVSQAAEMMGFAPIVARPMLRIGSDAVDPAATSAALLAHDAVRSARLARGERGLVADVLVDRPATPAELRTHLLGAVYDHQAARCPDWFRITDVERRVPLLQGAGHARGWSPVRTAAEQELTSVVAEVNHLSRVDLADSYSVAGGRVLRLPRVLAALHESGWEGVSMAQLASARPLLTLAGRMRRSLRADVAATSVEIE